MIANLPRHELGARPVQADTKANRVPFAAADEDKAQVFRKRIIIAAWWDIAGVVFFEPFADIRERLVVGGQGQSGCPCVVVHGAYAFVVMIARSAVRVGGRVSARTPAAAFNSMMARTSVLATFGKWHMLRTGFVLWQNREPCLWQGFLLAHGQSPPSSLASITSGQSWPSNAGRKFTHRPPQPASYSAWSETMP